MNGAPAPHELHPAALEFMRAQLAFNLARDARDEAAAMLVIREHCDPGEAARRTGLSRARVNELIRIRRRAAGHLIKRGKKPGC
jgi:hypothetical protein